MDEQDNKELGELIKQLADGYALALDKIAEKMEKLLKAIGNTYYRNREDVEDAVQTLYVKLYYVAKKFKDNKNASAWILKIYENSIKSDLRARNREKEFWEQNGLEIYSHNDIDELYIENHLFVRAIFDKLTKEEARLFIYYYWCKLSIREIADVVHKSKSSIDRILKKLEEKAKKILK